MRYLDAGRGIARLWYLPQLKSQWYCTEQSFGYLLSVQKGVGAVCKRIDEWTLTCNVPKVFFVADVRNLGYPRDCCYVDCDAEGYLGILHTLDALILDHLVVVRSEGVGSNKPIASP